MVLYNESKKTLEKNMNMVDSKISLVKSIIGSKLGRVPYAIPDHKAMCSESRKKCAYCVMFNKSKGNRFNCGKPSCNIPVCYLGSCVS